MQFLPGDLSLEHMTKSDLIFQLDNILAMNADVLVERQKLAFGWVIKNTGPRYVLFGGGQLGQMALQCLRKAGVEPLAFADNNPGLWESTIEGLPVLSPKSAADKFGNNAVFIVTVYSSAPVLDQLRGMGLRIASFAELAWQYPQSFLPYWALEYPHKIFEQVNDVRNAFALWGDDISRRDYVELLKWFTTLDSSNLPPHLSQKDIYFPDNLFSLLENEVFVDCGAFNGDSVGGFLERRRVFKKIIAIEPDPLNLQAFQSRIAGFPLDVRNRIQVLQEAVGSSGGLISFNATGTVGSSFGMGGTQVQCAPLDDILSNDCPTLIKMDIEGAEYDALNGARQVIGKFNPVLAICLYHAQEHLWKIPLLLRTFSDQYTFHLRRYSDECWETVCYAVPKNRSIFVPLGGKNEKN
jgi:FkbM family methyltransferase